MSFPSPRRLHLLFGALLCGGHLFGAIHQASGQDAESGAALRTVVEKDQFSGQPVTGMEMAKAIVERRSSYAPAAGEKAPAFELIDQASGRLTSLASLHQDRPVVLYFGSYNCDVAKKGNDEVLRLHRRFGDRYNFVMIYIREAHSLDWIGTLLGEFKDPVTDEQRQAAALFCRTQFKIPFPILVDRVADPVGTRWAGWPVRLFVIDTEGVVRYAGYPGPWGFSPSDQFQHRDGWQGPNDVVYQKESLERFLESWEKDSEAEG